MRKYFSEKSLVVILFILVLVVFTIAQSETQKMGKVNGSLMSSAQKAGLKIMASEKPVAITASQSQNN